MVGDGAEGLDPCRAMRRGRLRPVDLCLPAAPTCAISRSSKDFPGAEVVLLEQNYRSTQTILSAANALISHNTGRRDKRPGTDAGDGEQIVGYVADDDRDEAAFVVNEIQRLTSEGLDAGEIAIFYRTPPSPGRWKRSCCVRD